MRAQFPHQGLVAEVLRDDDAKDVLVATRHEMRRLATVATRLERVVRTDREVNGLLVIAVHVAEPHVVRAVGIDVEPLVDRRDALAGRVTDGDELRRALLRDERSHGDCADDRDDAQGFGDHAPIIGPKSVARSAQSCWLFPR